MAKAIVCGLDSVAESNLCKEYAEKGALFADACRESPETGTGRLIKRMVEVRVSVGNG